MSVSKLLLALAILVAALFGGGHYLSRQPGGRAPANATPQAAVNSAVAEVTAAAQAALPATRAPMPAAGPSGIAGVRKCKGSQGVIYTNELCPKGMKEVLATGGTVTVLPGQGGQATVAAAGGGKTLKEKLAGPPLPNISDKMIEKATNPTSP
jgi:hypothetical protein